MCCPEWQAGNVILSFGMRRIWKGKVEMVAVMFDRVLMTLKRKGRGLSNGCGLKGWKKKTMEKKRKLKGKKQWKMDQSVEKKKKKKTMKRMRKKLFDGAGSLAVQTREYATTEAETCCGLGRSEKMCFSP